METVDFDRLDLRGDQRILDLGCGEGRHALAAHLHGGGLVVGLDINPADVKTGAAKATAFLEGGASCGHSPSIESPMTGSCETAPSGSPAPASERQALAWLTGDARHLPFSSNTFDVIIISEVLEHLPSYDQVLDELQRVIRPDGVLAVSVPRFFPEWVCWKLSTDYHEVPGGHVRIFTTTALRRSLVRAGFHPVHRHWAHALHTPYWWLQCALWKHRTRSRLVRAYHKLLVWDLMERPRLTQWAERLLNPLLGKSVVLYCHPDDPSSDQIDRPRG